MADPAPDILGPLMGDLLACAHAALCDADREPALSFLNPGGEPAWDNCCEDGGQLWVRVVEMFPSGNPFPARDTRPRCHPVMWAARIAVGVVRCVHTIRSDGSTPTGEQMTSDALVMTADAAELQRAILCCFAAQGGNLMAWVIENWLPQGAQGGCGGGEWTIGIGFPSCACPPPEA